VDDPVVLVERPAVEALGVEAVRSPHDSLGLDAEQARHTPHRVG
jgi:hypothetical protein